MEHKRTLFVSTKASVCKKSCQGNIARQGRNNVLLLKAGEEEEPGRSVEIFGEILKDDSTFGDEMAPGILVKRLTSVKTRFYVNKKEEASWDRFPTKMEGIRMRMHKVFNQHSRGGGTDGSLGRRCPNKML